MKTAISIPDQVFEDAQELAHELKISRSELFTKAIEGFIKERDEKQITKKLNEIYENENSKLDTKIEKIQINSLKLDKEEW